MRLTFTVEVTHGDHTTDADLSAMRGNISASLNAAVADIGLNVFPEYVFSDVTECSDPDGDALDEAYAARHAQGCTPPF